MAPRVAVVIVKKDKILLIRRFKDEKEYYVIPGGSIKENESNEQAAIRETKEETGLDVILGEKIYEEDNKGRVESYFLVKSFSGELKLGNPEIARQSKDNAYILEWVSLKDLRGVNLLPKSIKNKILDTIS